MAPTSSLPCSKLVSDCPSLRMSHLLEIFRNEISNSTTAQNNPIRSQFSTCRRSCPRLFHVPQKCRRRNRWNRRSGEMRDVPSNYRFAFFRQRRRCHNSIFEIIHIAVSRRPELLCAASRDSENGKNPVNGFVRKSLPPAFAHDVVDCRKGVRGDKADDFPLRAQSAHTSRRRHPFSPVFKNVENDIQVDHDTPFHA